MTVIDFLINRLIAEKVKYIFGYQGGSITDIVAGVFKSHELEYIQLFHEQACCFAANAYARIESELGVCLVTNGPGVTNAVSAIADAYCDFVPLLVISGQVKTIDRNDNPDIRQNGFQEIDAEKLVKPITKYSHTIRCVDELESVLDTAIKMAKTPPFGPVLVDIPLDIQKTEVCMLENKREYPGNYSQDIDFDVIKDLIISSKRPLIVAGGGVRQGDACEELYDLVRITGMPVVRTLAGLDLITLNDAGFSGLYGNVESLIAVCNADLLIVLGSRLSKRQVGIEELYAPNAQIIHVDINAHELSRVKENEHSVCMDVKAFILKLINYFSQERIPYDLSEWNSIIQTIKEKYKDATELNKDRALQPYTLIKDISRFLENDAVITLDVGQNQMWCAQALCPKKGQRIITSGGLGCMGFSLPAAIGSYYTGRNNIYSFMGDGGIQMNIQELQYISHNRIPIKIFVFNNSSLGMIQEVQWKISKEEFYGSKIGYSTPDFAKIAKSYNLSYFRVESNSDIEKSDFNEIMENDSPALIELYMNGDLPLKLHTMYDSVSVVRNSIAEFNIFGEK